MTVMRLARMRNLLRLEHALRHSVRVRRWMQSCSLVAGAICYLLVTTLAPVSAAASWPQTPPRPALVIVANHRLDVTPSLQIAAANTVALSKRAATLLQRFPGQWELRWDTRGNRPNLVQGSGVPVIPSSGNRLQTAVAPANAVASSGLAKVTSAARRFLDRLPELLHLDGLDLRLDPQRSLGNGRGFWNIEFAQFYHGLRVDGAFVFVRISHGNVVQFGSERIGTLNIDTVPALSRDDAFKLAWSELAFPPGTHIAEMIEPGDLRIYPDAPAGEASGTAYAGAPGAGYEHVLAWRYVFRVLGDTATWQVLFDAHANRVIDVRDLTTDATVSGGIYPKTNLDTEIEQPFAYTALDNGGPTVTDANGSYAYSGGTSTAALDGPYFTINDTCGAISLSNSSDGQIDFGTGGDGHCLTPGIGGAGNTRAARNAFYHLGKLGAHARDMLPGNVWLQSNVVAHMDQVNVSQQGVCNSYWDGTQINFFRPAAECSNFGEFAAPLAHEWGHGLDQNSGGVAPDRGSGEALGDTVAYLYTHDACVGENLFPGKVCHGCSACTGVRDLNDFSLHGTRTLATPANVTSDTGIDCDADIYEDSHGATCPYVASGGSYAGPMGYEGHCESYIASSANRDLAQSLIDAFGEEPGWDAMDRLWYASLTPALSAYQVQSGGQCNPAAVVNGCDATNWYTVLLAVDDDDGNLANGTPNACRIWDAYNAHGIACGARPVCATGSTGFGIIVTPAAQAVCAPTDAVFQVEVPSYYGYANAVLLGISGQPTGSSAGFAQNPVLAGNTTSLTVSSTGAVNPGNYSLAVSGSGSDSPNHVANAVLTVNAAAPATPVPIAPAPGEQRVSQTSTFRWQAVPDANTYTVEVALDQNFTNIVAGQSGLTTTAWQPDAPLTAAIANVSRSTPLFWRVRALNACGVSGASAAFAFRTGDRYCHRPALAIPDNDAMGINDELRSGATYYSSAVYGGLRIFLQASHQRVGDLSFALTLRDQFTNVETSEVVVLDRVGYPGAPLGCEQADIETLLDDDADQAAQAQCHDAPAVSGWLRPISRLDPTLSGLQLDGNYWRLRISDNATGVVGRLIEWCIEAKPSPGAGYYVRGRVYGLQGSGLKLTLNGGLPQDPGTSFNFSKQLYDGFDYHVRVAAQPVDPVQTCVVSNGNGVIAGASVDDVAVECNDVIFANGFD